MASIARWLFNEASSGTTPTTIVDDTGNGNTLTIDYSSGDAVWSSIAAGNGLDFTATPITSDSALAYISDVTAAGNIGSSINGVTSLAFVIVVDVDAGSSSGARIFQLGTSTGNGTIALVEDAFELIVRVNDTNVAGFGALSGEGPQVVYCEIDTTQATAEDRVKLWLDNVQESPSSVTISQNETINANTSDHSFVVGNRFSANRNFDGKVYYLELFDAPISSSDRATLSTNLASDNDANWVVANSDPVLDTPISDISVSSDTSGTIADISGNFSDANSDPLTYSVTPALPSGMSLNTSTGVITGNGSITETAAANYTFSADDGQGGTPASDVVSVEVTAPVFTADSITAGTINVGDTVTIQLSNASASGKTLSVNGVSVTPTTQDASSISFLALDPFTFAGGIYRFAEDIPVTVVDGAQSDSITYQTTPDTGYTQFAVPDPIAGVWASTEFSTAIDPQVLAIGDYIWCTDPADSDAPNGSFPESSSIDYRIMDMSDGTPAWGDEGTITVAPSTATVDTGLIPLTIQSGWSLVELNSPVTTEGSVLEGYTGDTPVTGDHLEYIITSTLDAGVGLVINPTGEWVVTQASEGDWVTDITVNRRVVQVDGTIGDAGVITLSAQSGVVITLDDVTSNASGDVNLVASLNITLQNVTPSITGNTLVDGSLDATLGNVIPITSGAIRVVGVLNSSLEDVVLFSSQINTAVFTGAVEDVESSISGEVYLNGSLNRTLERVNISATTELIINSSLSKILDNTNVTSSATVTVEGSLSETLDDTIIFTGAVVVGSSTIQLQDVEVSINAESLTIANLDEVIDQVIQASSGDVLLDGTINEVLDSIQISTDGEITLSGDLLGTVEDVRIATSSVPEIVTVITYLVYLFDSYTRG